MKRFNIWLLTVMGCMSVLAVSPAFAETPSIPSQFDSKILTGFISKHCQGCHGAEKQEGKLRLDTLRFKIANRSQVQKWQQILGVLKDGKMPPEDAPQPSTAARNDVVHHLTTSLQKATKRFGRGHQYKAGAIAIAAAAADEPKVESFNRHSVLAASKYLDEGAVAWVRTRKCITCHTTGTYMAERPGLTKLLGPPRKEVLNNFVNAIYDEPAYKGDFWFVWRSLGLAQWDKHVSGQLSDHTAKSLRQMFSRQMKDGSWDIARRNIQIPHVTTKFELAVQAARAVVAAPGWLDQLEGDELNQRVNRMKSYLRQYQPRNDYERALKLKLASVMPELVIKAEIEEAIAMLRRQQQPDGGWSTRRMSEGSTWSIGKTRRIDELLKSEPDAYAPGSDPYMTALAIVLLRESNIPTKDEQIQRGIAWLKTNQRQSGRWWMKSLSFAGNNQKNFTTYISTAQALRALSLCGEIEPTQLEEYVP